MGAYTSQVYMRFPYINGLMLQFSILPLLPFAPLLLSDANEIHYLTHQYHAPLLTFVLISVIFFPFFFFPPPFFGASSPSASERA